jgi:2-oxoglutarate ferredoxin oxidoreductase subunit beta
VARFQPAAIALASGASFIARGFSGDPNGLTRLLVDAVQHPGFAFVQVLSPCQTFRPEQREWKDKVHPCRLGPTDNPAEAARLIQLDDGMALGVLYAQHLPVWQPKPTASASLADIEAELLP